MEGKKSKEFKSTKSDAVQIELRGIRITLFFIDQEDEKIKNNITDILNDSYEKKVLSEKCVENNLVNSV